MERKRTALGLLLFGIFIATSSSSLGQVPECCPYVSPLQIIPSFPSELDTTFVITNVTTANLGTHLGYEVIDSGNVIYINACFFAGVATSPSNFIDTISIGSRTPGEYDIVFTAYKSSSYSDCIPNDSNSVSTILTVGYVGIEEPTFIQEKTAFYLDLLGRKVDNQPNTVLIKVFEDGRREKVFWID